MPKISVRVGDCIDAMRAMPRDSVDSVVSDPPYNLEFMGHQWDGWDSPKAFEEWCRLWAVEALRVLKPGGWLLAFGGTRTWHRLAVGVEDAGFEMRDNLAWLYGSGFPKSLDVSKAIDRAAGAEREVVGLRIYGEGQTFTGSARGGRSAGHMGEVVERGPSLETAPATPEAEQWQGWGTALKPAFEPIVVARKPLGEKTVAANVLKYGTGALNIDGCRVGTDGGTRAVEFGEVAGSMYGGGKGKPRNKIESLPGQGRWPANVLLSEDQADVLEGQSGSSRFFYCAKAPKSERPIVDGLAHPTVKPLTVMRWMTRLVTPPQGTVLDMFAGTGTTLEAAWLEGFDSIGIENWPAYIPLIRKRLEKLGLS